MITEESKEKLRNSRNKQILVIKLTSGKKIIVKAISSDVARRQCAPCVGICSKCLILRYCIASSKMKDNMCRQDILYVSPKFKFD